MMDEPDPYGDARLIMILLVVAAVVFLVSPASSGYLFCVVEWCYGL